MNASDLAAERKRNAQSLRDLEFIQREVALKPARLRRPAFYLEPLIEGEIGERELTMRGLRCWGRMK